MIQTTGTLLSVDTAGATSSRMARDTWEIVPSTTAREKPSRNPRAILSAVRPTIGMKREERMTPPSAASVRAGPGSKSSLPMARLASCHSASQMAMAASLRTPRAGPDVGEPAPCPKASRGGRSHLRAEPRPRKPRPRRTAPVGSQGGLPSSRRL